MVMKAVPAFGKIMSTRLSELFQMPEFQNLNSTSCSKSFSSWQRDFKILV